MGVSFFIVLDVVSCNFVLQDSCFRLNDGPSLEDAVVEPGPWNSDAKTKGNSGFPLSGWRMNGEVVNLTSCLPPGNSHPGLAIHSYPSDGTERSYPVLTSASGPTYNCDPYRGSVITSAPANTQMLHNRHSHMEDFLLVQIFQ